MLGEQRTLRESGIRVGSYLGSGEGIRELSGGRDTENRVFKAAGVCWGKTFITVLITHLPKDASDLKKKKNSKERRRRRRRRKKYFVQGPNRCQPNKNQSSWNKS